ncbi:MtrB/PioB family decaheme-associated outer membrane protein [Ideonella sp.]|uniref:MtrB/PioB family decaheme-associated outer membrane protein n=1 Tax=Ideonella sp. TaxID=1929293 RepID=UPI002B45BD64|nr:MtrB/PioB family decaheme-associated outer membrane protein [Ideonella sp.]HJV70079.1 MtrB/PioB family decaheme-associated outer membrane protein [Ideonella sp.]
MSAQRNALALRPVALAVQAAITSLSMLSPAARADDSDEVKALVQPTNTVEIGVGYDTKSSPKFGEYSGLTDQGADLIGNLDLSGGTAYGLGSGTYRYRLTATDLGLTSRRIDALATDQGRWRLGLSFDSLRHSYTDTYQTPLVGSMGGNSFVLPQPFGVVSTASAPTPYGTQNLTDTQKSFFHPMDVHSDRQTSTLAGGLDFNERFNLRVSWGHVEQDGAKLMSVATDGNIAAPGSTPPDYKPGREAILLLANPTAYTTDTLRATLNWTGEHGFASVSYVGSRFTDGYRQVDFSNPYTSAATVPTGTLLGVPFPLDAVSTMPDNTSRQFGLTGGYELRPTTRFAGSVSRAVITQDQAYVNLDQMQAGGLPRNSLDGRVVTTHADLKITDRSIPRLVLAADLKYNERENRTASATYGFLDLGAAAESSVNTPMSHRRTQLELAGDYRWAPGQTLHLGYENEKVERWCRNAAANAAQGTLSETNTGYYTVASCVQVPQSTEDKLNARYRQNVGEDAHMTLGLGYGKRDSTVNASFYNPMQTNDEGFENYGYLAFFQASREQWSAKAAVDWQATKALSLSASARAVRDDYTDSALGVQHGNGANANLDATYEVSDKTSVSAFATWQHRTRSLLTANGRNAVAALTNLWSNHLTDDATTVGVSARQAGLAGGRLQLKGDLVYSLATTGYETVLHYEAASCTAPSNAGYSCGPVPDIRSRLLQLKLAGEYLIDKRSALTLGYQYQKLSAADYLYNFYQMGYTGTTTLPTNQALPDYTQNRVFLIYRYSFL